MFTGVRAAVGAVALFTLLIGLAAARPADADTLVTAGADKKVKLWDMKDGKLNQSIDAHDGAVNALALNDTHIVLILLYATFFVSLGTLVMRAFVDQIPRELDEAAMVDGAGPLAVFWRVILPLCAQGMVAVGVFVLVFAWNEFLFAFIFTTTKAKTAPLTLSEMTGAVDGVEWGVLFAATTLQLAPIVTLVIVAQRYLIAGLTAGATKG
jgi:multiple sugar transport system permease protein